MEPQTKEGGSDDRELPAEGDLLDAVVELDEQWFEEGYEAGQEEGRKRSLAEGEATGQAKGYEIGCELGFYEACCRVWCEMQREAGATVVHDASPDQERQERLKKPVLTILDMIRDFPMQNSSEVDFVDKLQRIRAKFKAATNLMGVRLPFSLRPPVDEGLTF